MLYEMISLIKTPVLLLAFVLFLILPLLFSIAFHEFAHGYVAYKFGDITPKIMGRITLNPFAHLDFVGTLMLFVIGLGWAKPVLITAENIPTPTKRMLVALAGPVSNFLLAVFFALLISLLENDLGLSPNNVLVGLFNTVVMINIALGVFNLIPIPPLDGSRIVTWLLPNKLKGLYNKFENYGMLIMIVLLVTVGFGGIFKLAQLLQQYLYLALKVTI